MTKQLFDDMIGTPPPSTVDVKAIVRRETRMSTFRRATGVIALTVAVVTGVSLTKQNASPPVDTPSPSPSASVVEETPHARDARVKAAWQRATAKVGGKWKAGHDGSQASPSRADYYDDVATPNAPPLTIGQEVSYTMGLVEVAGVEGKLHFRTCLTQTRPGLHCPPQPECPPGCLRKTGPNGEPITIWTKTEDVPGYPLPYVQCWVQIRSPDGKSAAELTLDNVLGPDGSAQTSSKLPLTPDQMLAILLEPGLML